MPEARTRLADARAQLELAVHAGVGSSQGERKAAASSAVLAGIAAADAACCAVLGERSRSQDHRDAAGLLRSIEPAGDTAAKAFRRLIGVKDAAQYGFDGVSAETLLGAQRQAALLVEFAAGVLAR
jgi:hypothetical protein